MTIDNNTDQWLASIDKLLDSPELSTQIIGDDELGQIFSNVQLASTSTTNDNCNNVSSTTDDAMRKLLFVAFLDYVCHMVVGDNIDNHDRLFQGLSMTIRESGIIPSMLLSYQLAPLRSSFRHAFSRLLHEMVGNAQCKSNMQISPTMYADYCIYNTLNSFSNDTGLFDVCKMSTSEYGLFPNRYSTDFQQLNYLGKGGFGHVYKVLREVQLLARLNHANIVRYYSSWFELDSIDVSNVKTNNKSNTTSPRLNIQEIVDDNDESLTNAHYKSSNGSARMCRNLSWPSMSADDSILKTSTRSHRFWRRRLSSLTSEQSDDDDASSINNLSQHDDQQLLSTRRYPVLYMQMELCNSTLKDYLVQRNAAINITDNSRFDVINETINLRLLQQLLEAVDYIHSENIMHRDIKPNNIFLRVNHDGQLQLLLGDFGLACTIETCTDDGNVIELPTKTTNRHSQCVGTYTYSAPEQLKSNNYDSKVDIFSVGIVTFELYFPFVTRMEKHSNIIELRNDGTISDLLAHRWPFATAAIHRMTRTDPQLRPSARTLINELFAGNNNSLAIASLENTIIEQANEIRRLKLALSNQQSNGNGTSL